MFATVGALQLYVVPAGRVLVPANVFRVTALPLQMAAGVWFVTLGVGLTVTVTVKVFPVQVPDLGVTVYTTLMGALLLFVNVPEVNDV
jgi:hypothetical protein